MQPNAMEVRHVIMEKNAAPHDLWHELNIIVEDYLEKITINSLVESYEDPYIKVKEIN